MTRPWYPTPQTRSSRHMLGVMVLNGVVSAMLGACATDGSLSPPTGDVDTPPEVEDALRIGPRIALDGAMRNAQLGATFTAEGTVFSRVPLAETTLDAEPMDASRGEDDAAELPTSLVIRGAFRVGGGLMRPATVIVESMADPLGEASGSPAWSGGAESDFGAWVPTARIRCLWRAKDDLGALGDVPLPDGLVDITLQLWVRDATGAEGPPWIVHFDRFQPDRNPRLTFVAPGLWARERVAVSLMLYGPLGIGHYAIDAAASRYEVKNPEDVLGEAMGRLILLPEGASGLQPSRPTPAGTPLRFAWDSRGALGWGIADTYLRVVLVPVDSTPTTELSTLVAETRVQVVNAPPARTAVLSEVYVRDPEMPPPYPPRPDPRFPSRDTTRPDTGDPGGTDAKAEGEGTDGSAPMLEYPRIFIELWGPPGYSLTNVALLRVTAKGGFRAAPEDGWFPFYPGESIPPSGVLTVADRAWPGVDMVDPWLMAFFFENAEPDLPPTGIPIHWRRRATTADPADRATIVLIKLREGTTLGATISADLIVDALSFGDFGEADTFRGRCELTRARVEATGEAWTGCPATGMGAPRPQFGFSLTRLFSNLNLGENRLEWRIETPSLGAVRVAPLDR